MSLKRRPKNKAAEREEEGDIEGDIPNGNKSLSYVLSKMFMLFHLKSKKDCPALEHIMNHISTSLFVNQSLFLSLMELVSQTSL